MRANKTRVHSDAAWAADQIPTADALAEIEARVERLRDHQARRLLDRARQIGDSR